MKCSNVRKEIERMAYQYDTELGAEVYRHIDSCKDCAQYLEETRLVAGKIAGMRQREPILKDPEGLTENIMKAIQIPSQENQVRLTEKLVKSPVISILQRLTAAATVCLFLVFGYEEYIVVDKISRLEKQNATISESSQYQAALKLNKVISLLDSDPEMLSRYEELKTRKINLRTLLRAAMYADVAGITPDALKRMNRADFNDAKPPYMSIFKQFDSTYNNIKQ
jgi:hypothetical protein